MKLLNLSLILILLALSLCLNIPSQAANENSSQNPIPSKSKLTKPEQPKKDHKHEQPQPDQRGTEQSPVVIKIQPSPNTQEDAAAAKKEKEERAAAQYRSENLTIVNIIIGLVQAGALIVTICVMVRTTRHQLRAYVLPNSVTLSDLNEKGPIKALVLLKNCGKTPATHFSWTAQVRLLDLPISEFPPHWDEASGEARSIAVVPPDQKIGSDPTLAPLTNADKFDIMEDRKAIFVWGEARYKDIFGKPHKTIFRYIRGGGYGLSAGEMSPCDQGNDAT